jgi:GrpB-like predicted nucleotidyltransferase (UPF0157 family)
VKPDPNMPIVIVEYDAAWPALYEAEVQKLLGVLGAIAIASEHIGSTSIPGLAAKPIIDIMLAVSTLESVLDYQESLNTLGYTYVPEFESILPDGRYFNKGDQGIDTYHLHVVEKGKDFWVNHLLFRDYLRAHPETARQYAELKHSLAGKFSRERDQYTDSKGDFIDKVLELARTSS